MERVIEREIDTDRERKREREVIERDIDTDREREREKEGEGH